MNAVMPLSGDSLNTLTPDLVQRAQALVDAAAVAGLRRGRLDDLVLLAGLGFPFSVRFELGWPLFSVGSRDFVNAAHAKNR